jgi:hypothetical protein
MKQMTRSRALSAVVMIASLLLTAIGASAGPVAAQPAAVVAGPKLVLAFYYPWYGPGAFDQGKTSDRPTTPYISDHPDVIDRQISEAQAAGIDGFIVEWAGNGDITATNFPLVFEAAARHNFQITFYLITDSVRQHGDLVGQLQGLLNQYSGQPAFLHWNNKPVFFVWAPDALPGGVNAWRDVRRQVDPNNGQFWSVETTNGQYLDVFDSIHLFSGGKWDAKNNFANINNQFRGIVDKYNRDHGTQRLWTAGVIPGWDETRLGRNNPGDVTLVNRNDGATYNASWQSALKSNPEWVTITSYNEWFEGTQIEPSVTYGNKYLDLTRNWACQYKGNCGGQPQPQPQPPAPQPPAPQPPTGCQNFPETGQQACGTFLAYWQSHGGLAQQGYPISPEMQEKSDLDGKTYTVQYFERALFEHHPENAGTPYEVLLAQLGTYRFKGLYPNGASSQSANKDAGHLFNETNHWAGGAFYAYWNKNGGLAQQGYPLTDEFQETSALDGKTYMVQYFERAVFEWHPENAGTPYNVLLSQLGMYQWKGKHSGTVIVQPLAAAR